MDAFVESPSLPPPAESLRPLLLRFSRDGIDVCRIISFLYTRRIHEGNLERTEVAQDPMDGIHVEASPLTVQLPLCCFVADFHPTHHEVGAWVDGGFRASVGTHFVSSFARPTGPCHQISDAEGTIARDTAWHAGPYTVGYKGGSGFTTSAGPKR